MLLRRWDSPGKNTAVGCHFLLQEIFLTKDRTHISCIAGGFFTTEAAHQAPLSMVFSRQEHWSGVPFPSAEDLPDPGIKLGSPALQADPLPTELWEKPLAP